AKQYISEEHELASVEDVLAGTNDILAEWISDEASYREHIRSATWKKGKIETEAKDSSLDEKEVYKMYYEYSEPINTLVSHRILAINRGEKECVLRVSVQAPIEGIITYLGNQVIAKRTEEACDVILDEAIEDNNKCLIEPTVERENSNRITAATQTQE